MSHTYANLLYHMIWSTKERRPLILRKFQNDLYQYIGGIVRAKDGQLFEIGGIEDHVHLLVGLKPAASPADVVKHVKSGSTVWIKQAFPEIGTFSWQEGYGVFSVSQSIRPKVADYISRQEEHHKNLSFEEEWLKLLDRHGIAYNVQYAFG